jgi:hypothetical protein
MEDKLRKKLMAFLRVINYDIGEFSKSDWRKRDSYVSTNDDLYRRLKNLSKAEKQAMIDILVALTLLTAGNQEVIRNPEKFDPKDPGIHRDLFSQSTSDIIKILDPWYSGLATKKNYQLAKKLLPILGSTHLEPEDFRGTSGESRFDDERIGGFKKLYRGINDIESRIIAAALRPNVTWDIQRGVSTSTDKSLSAGEFAKSEEQMFTKGENIFIPVEGGVESRNGSSILFIFDNPKGKGMIAQNLSYFPTESEVILSGTATIKNWSLQFIAKLKGERGVFHVSINNLPNKINIEVRGYDFEVGRIVEQHPLSSSSEAYKVGRMLVSRGVMNPDHIVPLSTNNFMLIAYATVS